MKALLRLWKMTGLAAAIVFLAGCWSATELNNRAFVSVMILDSKNDEVELTLGIPLTNRLIPGQTGEPEAAANVPSLMSPAAAAPSKRRCKKFRETFPAKSPSARPTASSWGAASRRGASGR